MFPCAHLDILRCSNHNHRVKTIGFGFTTEQELRWDTADWMGIFMWCFCPIMQIRVRSFPAMMTILRCDPPELAYRYTTTMLYRACTLSSHATSSGPFNFAARNVFFQTKKSWSQQLVDSEYAKGIVSDRKMSS